MRRHLAWITALTVTALLSGCVSMHYQPRNTPYLKIVQVDGVQKFRVGDVDYSGGILGGLDGAVASVPEALAHAEEAESDAVIGLILTIVGSTLVGLGTGALTSEAVGTSSDDGIFGSDTGTFGTIFLVGGLATTVGAMFELSSATAHQVDAINIFNDTMWEREHADQPMVTPGLPPLRPLEEREL